MHRQIYCINAFLITVLLFLLSCSENDDVVIKEDLKLELISNDLVYDNQNHAAFTSMISYKNNIYLAFRVGANHVPISTDQYGYILIFKKNKNTWEEMGAIRNNKMDLRDPCFAVVDNHLRIYCGYNQFNDETGIYSHSGSIYSDMYDNKWSDVKIVNHDAPHVVWIWKIREHNDNYYGVGYLESYKPILMKSSDGNNWNSLSEINVEGVVSEADLCFVGDSLYMCLRQDSPLGAPSYWIKSSYPYNDLQIKKMDICIACPELNYYYDSNQIMMSGREYVVNSQGKVYDITIPLYHVNTDGKTKLMDILNIDGQWDKGYPSLLFYEDTLYVSYYHVIEGANSGIYVAQYNFK